jgi:hypothetical protein
VLPSLQGLPLKKNPAAYAAGEGGMVEEIYNLIDVQNLRKVTTNQIKFSGKNIKGVPASRD